MEYKDKERKIDSGQKGQLEQQLTEEERALLFSDEEEWSENEERGVKQEEKMTRQRKIKDVYRRENGKENRRDNRKENGREGRKSSDKKMSKKKKCLIIAGMIGLLIFSSVAKSVVKSMMPVSIEVSTAKIGEIQKNLDTSGIFKSMRQKIYFSPVSATVSKCYVQVGDIVKENAKLVDFDLSELEMKKTEANLQKDSNYYSYIDTLEKSKKAEQNLANADNEIMRLKNQISTQKNNINNIQNYIAELNRSQGIQNSQGSSQNTSSSAADASFSEQANINADSMMSSAQRDLEKAQEDLAELQKDLSKYETEKEQAKSSILTEDEKKKLEVEKYSAELSAQMAGETATRGSLGITAEFDGIVTDIKTPTGSMAAQGGELMTIESNKEIYLEVELSKYDLETVEEGEEAKITFGDYKYDGIVSKISRTVVKNVQGKSSIIAEVKVTNPDDNIYLGIDAKVKIEGKKYQNILVIPTESINVSKNESYCYVIKDSRVQKRVIETGVTDNQNTQIVEGLKQGEQVVANPENVVENGKKVIPIEKKATRE